MSWHTVKLGEICTFNYGKGLSQDVRDCGVHNVYGSNGVVGTHSKTISEGPTIIVGRKGSIGEVNWDDHSCWPIDTTYYIDRNSTNQNLRWLYWRLKNLALMQMNKSAAVPGLNREDAYRLEIKIPPLDEQKRIAEILDKAAEIQAKREQAIAKLDELAKSTFVEMYGDPVLNSKNLQTDSVKNLCKLINGRAFKPSEWEEKGLPIIRIQNLNDETKSFNYTTQEFDKKYLVRSGDVLFSWSGTPGTSFGCFKWTRQDGWLNQHIFKVVLNTNLVNPDFFIQQLNLKINELISQAHGGVGLQHVTKSMVDDLKLLMPKLDHQNEYAEKLKKIDEITAKFRAYQVESIKLNSSLGRQAFTTGFAA